MAQNPVLIGRPMRPTLKHRPAIWEMMLGTVYAMNDAGEVRYFDYNWEGARAFAGVDEPDRDPRHSRALRGHLDYLGTSAPNTRQMVLWVLKK